MLKRWQQESASEQAVSTCSLALAMLSSFSRVPELASSQDILEKTPLLVKVCLALNPCCTLLKNESGMCAADVVGMRGH